MRMPGFTAEFSIQATTNPYTGIELEEHGSETVSPAARWCGYVCDREGNNCIYRCQVLL